jgi:2-polyprenyl-6-hydroxyphenyl methylase/3-demethylubiquinone-9 3-methyltransferase
LPERLPEGAAYHEALAGTWREGHRRGSFRRRLAFAVGLLDGAVAPGARWLDVGCGAGVLAAELARRGACGEGVDASPAMVAAARAEQVPGFSFACVNTVERLPYPDASFDGVLCSSVVEYLDAPDAALDEMARVLRPGGFLVVSLANGASWVRLAQRGLRALGRWLGRDWCRYLTVSRVTHTRPSGREALERRGLTVARCEDFDPWLPGWLPGALLFFVAHRPAVEGASS